MTSAFSGGGVRDNADGNGIEEYPERTCKSCGETFKRLPDHMVACEET